MADLKTNDIGRYLLLALIVLLAAAGLCQSPSSKYQIGTILAVKPEKNTNSTTSSSTHYEITVRVNNIDYVVDFTPPPGTYGVQYAAGNQLLVFVGKTTITFNDQLGRSREVPIISQKIEAGHSAN
jgi:hypothetical protein